ncbi:MAG: GLPGLI family protein [Polaribacter sp.]|jgi:GLPGLI family protein|nr:GLPGLI family protein [Polaribacter sp.]MBT7817488.1 GLPGLI family protein [Polaribacter sp.]MDG1194061.1 GLPGLI family protein [Polaribacter sp.]MDG2275924.1 GLPGLI family protein [Flavobacteriaceae bacterium]
MKLLFTFLLAIITVTTFAQKDFQGKATYMSKTTMDMSRFGDQMSEQQKKQMMARFKNFLEKNYTLSFNKTASSFKEDVKLDAPGTTARRWGNNNGQGSIYKNLKDREMIEDVEQFSKRFLVVEQMDQPKWEMGMETKKIGQYTCYKATMVKVDNKVDWGKMFSRRGNSKKKDSTETVDKKEDVKMLAVTAWYTPQIPVSSGPGTYFGLPGLILEINEGRTTMLCTEIVMNPAETIEIKKPTKGKEVNREEYNKIVKKKSEEIREQFKSRGRGGRRF